MRKTMSFFLIVAVVLISILMIGCSKPKQATPKEEKYVWRYGNLFADTAKHPTGQTMLFFIDEFNKRISKDRVEFVIYPSGQLGNSTEAILGGVLNRTAELWDYNAGSYGAYTTAFTPIECPYIFISPQQAYDLLDGEGGKLMKEKAIKDAGLHVVFFTDTGFRQLTNSKKPVSSPGDMKGLKIRVMNNPVYIKLMETLGALPAPMGFAELYPALQQGVIDGQDNPIVSVAESKMYEIQKYMTITNHCYGVSTTVMSEEYYQSLPADIRQALDEAGAIAQKKSREINKEFEDTSLTFLKTQLQVIELSEAQRKVFQAAAQPMWSTVSKLTSQEYFDKIVSYIK